MASRAVHKIAKFRRQGYRVLSILGAFDASQSGSKAQERYLERRMLGKAIRAITSGSKR